MRQVLNNPILVLEAVLHFLMHVGKVFLELSDRLRLDIFDLVSLVLKLRCELFSQLSLPLLPSFLLSSDGILHNSRFFLEEVKGLPFSLHSSFPFIFEVLERGLDALVDGRELPVEGLDPFFFLLVEEVFKHLHPVVPSLDFRVLVGGLLVVLVLQLTLHIRDLLYVLILVDLEAQVDFAAFVDGVLLVVLDLGVDVLELLFELSLGLVPEPDHLVELLFDLLDLVVEPLHFQVLRLCGFVHYILFWIY